jgi:hypothetical protein
VVKKWVRGRGRKRRIMNRRISNIECRSERGRGRGTFAFLLLTLSFVSEVKKRGWGWGGNIKQAGGF